ncbi:hypothetical protein [Xenorhabdus lircayensis]|uniref:Transposase n=1 Tax=Xenorhabdus lircayensis TaxID=2763499 RepID=A0ABS0U9W5_9GAMM|nr:hypothetical protein [Xenorhabdus lircayensis]MBI6550284.1 hypothetical protein [Xenorhabdus lircayensis]
MITNKSENNHGLSPYLRETHPHHKAMNVPILLKTNTHQIVIFAMFARSSDIEV